jgi:hypothetical protein
MTKPTEDVVPNGIDATLIVDIAEIKTLAGDIRDALLTHVRGIRVPWALLAEDEQKQVIDSINRTAHNAVHRMIELTAMRGFPAIPVTIGKWTVNAGVQLAVNAQATIENINQLAEHNGGNAVLVLTDVSSFTGERAAALADKDQPSLPNIQR